VRSLCSAAIRSAPAPSDALPFCEDLPGRQTPQRRQFWGTAQRSLVTGQSEEVDKRSLHLLRRTMSTLACLILAAGCVVAAVYICSLLPIFCTNLPTGQLRYSFGQNLVAVLVALQVFILNRALRAIALNLTRCENHRSRSEFAHAYQVKALALQFVNSYASLFYIAFSTDVISESAIRQNCDASDGLWWNSWGNTHSMARLSKQLATLLLMYCLKVAVWDAAWHGLARKLLAGPGGPVDYAPPRRSLGAELVQSLDRAMAAPRWGDPEADSNASGSCCVGPASELVLVFGMLVLFAVACPWAGLLALLFWQLRNWVDSWRPSRPALPWRAGSPACPFADVSAKSDVLWRNSCQVLAWLAAPVASALLVWNGDLGASLVSSAVLGTPGSDWKGSAFAPWGLYSVLLLVVHFMASRCVGCMPDARRLRLAEARLCRAVECARQGFRSAGTGSMQPGAVRGRFADFRVRTSAQWEDLNCTLAAGGSSR